MEYANNMYVNPMLKDTRFPTCLAPWNALTIKWGGNVLPDIIYQGKFGNITKQTLPEILNSKEAVELRKAHAGRNIPPACIACQKKEQSGKSRRMYFWDKLDEDVKRGSIKNNATSKPDIRYLDFTISNKCNLACLHCNPFVSTGWTKDGKKLNKEAPDYWEQAKIGYHGVTDMQFLDNLFADPDYFRNLQWVALRGGEPLYDESCKAILQWFIDQGLSKNIMLDISTNATVFDKDFQEIFKHFKHIELLISIEAVDELYSIIRGGKYTFKELENNIEKFYTYNNIEVVFAVTVMSTNIFGLDKVWKWFKEKHEHRASISMSNVVVNPSYLNIAYLPEELKYIMYDKLLQIPDRSVWPKGSYHSQEIHYQTGIHAIRDGLQLEGVDEKDQEKYWQWFMRYTKDLDRLRGTDTFKFIKELKYYE